MQESIQEAKETIFEFSQETVKVSWMQTAI